MPTTDAPIDKLANESLGMVDYVAAIGEFIRTCDTPMTIAFQGDWGSGKTSLMNLVQEDLKKGPMAIETSWLNTWQFSQFNMGDEITIALLMTLLESLGGAAKSPLKMVKALAKMSAKTVFGNCLSDIIDAITATDKNPVLQVKNLRAEIGQAIKKLLAEKKADRLVVFIDDMDRLVPVRAVEILEVLKLFLDVPSCVFVLAVDYSVVSTGLAQKFGVSTQDLKGRSFFDKIIQLPFNMPVAQYDIKGYLEKLLVGMSVGQTDMAPLVKLAEHSVGTNPRTLKRLVNNLQLLYIVAEKRSMMASDSIASTTERLRLLFTTLCLQLGYESVYRYLLGSEITANDLILLTVYDDLMNINESQKFITHTDDVVALMGLVNFMNVVWEAIQLKSNGNNDELSENEWAVFKSFLSLSAITLSGDGIDIESGNFPYHRQILKFVEETLNPQFQGQLKNSEFQTEFDSTTAYIGFDWELPSIGTIHLWISWHIDEKLVVSLWWVGKEENRNAVAGWAKRHLNKAYPGQRRNDMRYREFYFLQEDSLKSKSTQEQLKLYFDFVTNNLEKILPILAN